MIALPIAISIMCALLAVALFVESFKIKRGLYSRLVGLAPGAPLGTSTTKTKRVRNLTKASALTLK
jgi:hypothetical protein